MSMQLPFHTGAGRAPARLWYPCRPIPFPRHSPMIELNPIRQRIADLQDRLASLRGYL
ncbi:hypothetical protein MUU77_09720 [Pseudoxanthomonas sp. F37]|uniref:hypothetical protein n=1 Tax=Pseudoxanthomonas TaxID=83618 RepID=UPI001FD67B2F|nr:MULTISPECIES: hypothetical protein [Pseudoxanthomonas]UOV07066.1 hypothetical protein MUU75_02400 [Pseudoxanthomonas mexicana]UOV10622.1 hypothetical protein MUU77_09720 [Pseudoxanthomonas sp. F37]